MIQRLPDCRVPEFPAVDARPVRKPDIRAQPVRLSSDPWSGYTTGA